MQMNEPQLSVELADGVMEIIDRHGENTSEGGIYWNKQLGWDKKGSTAYNAEEECKKEVQSFLATALEEQIQNIIDANGFVAVGKDGKEVEYEITKVGVKVILNGKEV